MRNANGQYQRGQSGNPGGRPKMPAELKEAMQGLAEDAIRVLREAMQSDDQRARIVAAAHVLDRGYGKPAQTVNATLHNKLDLGLAHLEELKRRMDARNRVASGADDHQAPKVN